MTTATTKARTRKARKVAQDIVPKGPCVGFEAIESLVWRAQVASTPPVTLDEAVAAVRSAADEALEVIGTAVDDAIAEHKKRAEEYDRQERALRGWQVRHARPAPRHVPVAVATKSGAFYRLNSAGQMEAVPLDPEAEKHMTAILRLHAEQDGTPIDDTGPVPAQTPPAPAPEREAPSHGAGPVSQDDDPALD